MVTTLSMTRVDEFDNIEQQAAAKFTSPKPRNRRKAWWKVLLKYVFSTIGLLFLVIAYATIGGLIFQALEDPYDAEQRQSAAEASQELLTKQEGIVKLLYKLLDEENATEEEFKMDARDKLEELRSASISTADEHGYEYAVTTTYDPDVRTWTLSVAIMYSVTLITVVGYGHIVPMTAAGRLVTIAYALCGLPLMMMFLANVGEVLTDAIRLVYNKARDKASGKKSGAPDDHLSGLVVSPSGLLPGNVDTEPREVPSDRPVPVLLALILLALYIALGAVTFSVWEGWTPTDGAYFSFVTISTIGFGDYVPGSTSFNSASEIKVILSSVYMLLGMAVLSMVINVIQEVIQTTAKKVSKKLHTSTKKRQRDTSQSPIIQSGTAADSHGSGSGPLGGSNAIQPMKDTDEAPIVKNDPYSGGLNIAAEKIKPRKKNRNRRAKSNEEGDTAGTPEKKSDRQKDDDGHADTRQGPSEIKQEKNDDNMEDMGEGE